MLPADHSELYHLTERARRELRDEFARELQALADRLRTEFAQELADLTERVDRVHEQALRELTRQHARRPTE